MQDRCFVWLNRKSDKDIAFDKDIVDRHVAYLKSLPKDVLIAGGEFKDSIKGMLILKAHSKQEAIDIASDDPLVKAGMLDIEIYEWNILIDNSR